MASWLKDLPDRCPRRVAAGSVTGLVILFLLVKLPLGDCDLHYLSQFAGDADRFTTQVVASCEGTTRDDIALALLIDCVYAVAYGAALAWLIASWWRHWRVARLSRLTKVWILPLAAGVLDPWGEAHGVPGLWVVDGAAIPGPVGPNPSLTIAAFADRASERMLG